MSTTDVLKNKIGIKNANASAVATKSDRPETVLDAVIGKVSKIKCAWHCRRISWLTD